MIFGSILLINIATVIPFVAIFKFNNLVKYAISAFIIFCANIILIGNFLGIIHQLSNITMWFILHLVFLVFGWALWKYFKKPRLINFKINFKDFKSMPIWQRITLVVFTTVTVFCFVVLIYLIFIVPPNNHDSMVVHLVRVGYWMQHGSFQPWNAILNRQVIYPYNAQIILLWLVLFLKNDLLTPFLQFFSVIITALSIFGISRGFGSSKFIAIVISLVYLTFPQVILQSTTTQNDMAITGFLLAGTYFFLEWIWSNYITDRFLIMGSISFAISLGIKATSYYYFIGLIIGLLIIWGIKRIAFRQLLKFSIILGCSFIILSSPSYINNLINFQNPLGPPEFLKSESGVFNQGSLVDKLKVNSFRFIYQLISLDGFPFPIQDKFNQFKSQFASQYPNLFDTSLNYIKDVNGETFKLEPRISNNEDESWFGPIFPLLLIPSLIYSFLLVVKKKDIALFLLLFVGIVYALEVTVLRPGWDPFQQRYFNPVIAMLTVTFSLVLDKKTIRSSVVLILLISMIPLIYTTFVNDSKPIVTETTLYPNCSLSQNRISLIVCNYFEKITSIIPAENLPAKKPITKIESRIGRQTYTNTSQEKIFEYLYLMPEQSTIGLLLANGDWEYPYFGEKFQYKLEPVNNEMNLENDSWLNNAKIDFLVIKLKELGNAQVTKQFSLIQVVEDDSGENEWAIYKKN